MSQLYRNVNTVERSGGTKGYGFCGGILGYICLGPLGLLCGLIGLGEPKGAELYLHCNDCGYS
ncbi:MAG: hypothetical protein ACK5LT_06680 [Lachnospirales bacterium]